MLIWYKKGEKMSFERRRSRRLELHVSLQMKRIEKGLPQKNTIVQVVNLSKTGIGFETSEDLKLNECYNANLTIWTKETIPAVIKVVRKEQENGEFYYGGIFVGMTSADSIKIDIYDMLNDN